MLRFRIAAVLCALAIASPSFAQETLFAATQNPKPGALATVNPATGASAVVGVGFGADATWSVSSMAYNAATDTLLAGCGFSGITFSTGPFLRVDRGSGVASLIGLDALVPGTFDGFAGMTIQSGTNICYVVDGFATQNLSWVNQATGNIYQLGAVVTAGVSGNGLAFDILGNLFWIDQLNCYTIDPLASPPVVTATRPLVYVGFPAVVGTRRVNSMSLRPSTGVLFALVYDGPTTGTGTNQSGTTRLATVEAHPLLPTVTITFVGPTTQTLDALCWVGPAVLSVGGGGGAAGPQDKDRKHATLKGCFVGQTGAAPGAASALVALFAVLLAGLVARRCLA